MNVIAGILSLHRMSSCDWADAVYSCAGCHADEVATHQIFVDTESRAWNGFLCLGCVAALPERLPDWLSLEPIVECLHLNQTLGWRGQGYCRDCKCRGPFRAEASPPTSALASTLAFETRLGTAEDRRRYGEFLARAQSLRLPEVSAASSPGGDPELRARLGRYWPKYR